ncbi:uncharacterized protein TRAVEDRAFT_37052 [Trametes versicolor FP-101664 SS1]|uniref:uncharacterized protein n=1 Tax=Trametes versicolor (strain FP-101664) TaxID=717944 RepID=UPI0004621CEA|nr:uncharacterized protein TRAVEDRAFT_37052 [Trametes versicolor FP-101664 SS1]EIW59781.1 hypothetical protein TRAVEDRAFT_37052 [Trametes versicolor FP-101664 SS1]
MDVARARSPPASLTRRPIGPRSPGRAGTAPPRNIIPLDLSARLQEDAAPVYASPEPLVSSSPRADSPMFKRPPSEQEHTLSEASARGEPEGDTKESPRAQSPPLSPDEPGVSLSTLEDASEPPAPESDALPSVLEDASGESPSVLPDAGPPEATAAVTIPPPVPEPSPSPPRSDGSRPPSLQVSAHRRSLSEKSVQASLAAIPLPAPTEASSTPASTRASTPALTRMMIKRPPLPPPPALNFEAEPIQWKAMTLEAAQWTLTSEQLQETVSRAIRHSASESFIRVVPTHTFDVELPQELERLESLRMTTQAQYRFSMHRRTMLLQSLAALSQSQYPDNGDGEALYNLTTQLAELTVSCDRLMEALVRISDQRAQIQQVQNLHIASALSMALRKLNTSYAKRTADLAEARAQNEALNAELEEAWSMAQDMAQEMDDLDNFDLEFSDEDEDADALEAEIYNDMDRMSTVASVRNAEVLEITGKAVATKAMLTTLPTGEKQGDRTSRVFAAKKRSSRASKASLRIPKTPTSERSERPDRTSIHSIRRRQSRSKSIRRRPERNEAVSPTGEDVPQMPVIRAPGAMPRKQGSFLELSETRPVSPAISAVSEPPPPPPPEKMQGQMSSSPSEDIPPPAPVVPNPPPSPTFDSMSIPTISLSEEPKAPSSSWRARNLFSRRVQSMHPTRAADDTATAPLKRSISEVKQFDGWPFGSHKTQRFSVPVLSVIQPLRSRSSTDSAPAATSSRHSSTSTR